MTRQQIQQYFPDTYNFFKETSDSHAFWKAVQHVHLDEMKQGKTILQDLEQVFSSLHLIDGHHILQDRLEDTNTHEELMEMLTQLYVAYIYRNHGARVVNEDHGYDIEIDIADQLFAMGVVTLHNFEAPKLQFAAQIEDELVHMEALGKSTEDGVVSEGTMSTDEFLSHLKEYAKKLKEHPKAKHQVMASITDHAALPKEKALAEKIEENQEEIQKHFPHVAGIVLIDPTPGKERAKFVPFHGNDHDLEMLLNK